MNIQGLNNNPRFTSVKLMQKIQILYQNQDIDCEIKNQLVNLVKEAMKNGDYQPVNQIFKRLSYGATMSEVLLECIRLTQ